MHIKAHKSKHTTEHLKANAAKCFCIYAHAQCIAHCRTKNIKKLALGLICISLLHKCQPCPQISWKASLTLIMHGCLWCPPVIKGFVELYCSQRLDDHLGENKATCFKPKGENTANSAANGILPKAILHCNCFNLPNANYGKAAKEKMQWEIFFKS